ncbi:hypothetical protein L6164_003586 [Bauhinia variegata]|uniref:Uncharacterized protein n=1 Tax=Bauhinia variegata TaxID=167791 RepID=A0ACB9Q1T6_BAUVA|nr:hypothetical protein L6164_003586 [Bauhinia variegata]
MPLSDLETICNPSSPQEGGISISLRDVPPAHYLFKVKSYSLLMNTKVEKYETDVFGAGGHKWRLVLYPSGNKTSNGKGYVSLYLAIADTEKHSNGWKVDVTFKLFVFEQKKNNYLTIQDADGEVKTYHEMKTEWGFDQLILLETLLDSSNGYLVEDSCVFGAEVFVISHSGKWESLSMIKEPAHGTFTWNMEKFSTLQDNYYYSKLFTVGERDWKLRVYPKGNASQNGNNLSFFLFLTNCDRFPPKRTVYAEYKLRILDQLNQKNYEKKASHWFCTSSNEWGFPSFISVSDLHKASNGYIKDDKLIVQVQILTLSVVKLSS